MRRKIVNFQLILTRALIGRYLLAHIQELGLD